MAKTLSSDETMTAILSYLGILVLIPYFTTQGKRNAFMSFHIKQGLALFVFDIILTVVGMVVWVIPVIGWMIGLLMPIVWILVLIVAIIAIVKALKGEMWDIPVIGGFKDKFNV